MHHPLAVLFVIFEWWVELLQTHPFETIGITLLILAVLLAGADWMSWKFFRKQIF